MKLSKWEKVDNKTGFMLHVTNQEALEIINTLSAQILNKSSNIQRAEFYTVEGEYFSIAVSEKDDQIEKLKDHIDDLYSEIQDLKEGAYDE